jgi:hypoxanthine-DNA glycosylase
MKGKNVFSKREIELIESLIIKRCNAESAQQKNIRSKMRNLGFYGSDYGISDMTIDKFHRLIDNGEIKVSDGERFANQSPVVVETRMRSLSGKQTKTGLQAWSGDNPKVLILGTFPGEKSLAAQAYYQNKTHNSFFKIMEDLFDRPMGLSDKEFITSNRIALWDCMKEADRMGSLDSNIKGYAPNDIGGFLTTHPSISAIILNGTGDTTDVFEQNFSANSVKWNCKIISLPSTSNSLAKPFEEKLRLWKVVKDIVDGKS